MMVNPEEETPRNVSPSNSTDNLSMDCVDRHDMLWEPRLESLCDKWKDDCISRSEKHELKARTYKQRYAISQSHQ